MSLSVTNKNEMKDSLVTIQATEKLYDKYFIHTTFSRSLFQNGLSPFLSGGQDLVIKLYCSHDFALHSVIYFY